MSEMSKRNKFILWCVAVAVTSFWMWVNVRIWLQGPLFEKQDINNLSILGGLFILLLSILAIGFVLFQNRLWGLVFSLIIGGVYFLLFGPSLLNIIGVAILLGFFFNTQGIVNGEIRERIKMNSRLLVKKSLGNLILVFFVLISFAAYQSPAIESFKNIQKLPSSSEIFIQTIIEQAFGAQIETPDPQQKELVLNQITRETVRELNLFLQPYFKYAPPTLAFGLFLILWGVGWFFLWTSVFLGAALFWILKKIKFFKIEERDVKAETIEF